MGNTQVQHARRLAVILHADVVDSTSLVRENEAEAHDRIRGAFQQFSESILDHGGIAHEIRGDALVAEFSRASDAVSASISFQAKNTILTGQSTDNLQLVLRIGIAMGEVVIADNTLTGEGVVLAQRLEQLAEPGGVCISAAVREAMPSRLPFNYSRLAEQKLKGFDELTTVFNVTLQEEAAVPKPDSPSSSRSFRGTPRPKLKRVFIGSALLVVIGGVFFLAWINHLKTQGEGADRVQLESSITERPSVAVLPFVNASEHADQVYFADGITEDIITDLSKVSGLFVVARNSTFEYRASTLGAQKIAKELDVRYVLEGSVRRAEDRIRITAQLVDASQGRNLWAERYDRQLSDVFAVQSEVAAEVVKALAVTLKSGEHERLFQKHTTSIDAYDVFIRARRTVDVPSRANIERGEILFKRVIALDPNFAGGYAGLSFNYSVKARFGYGTSRAEDTQQSLALAKQAIRIDPQFGWSYVAMGGAQLAAGDPTAAVETMRQALTLLPGDYEVNLFAGLYLQFAGDAGEAIKHLELAKRMNPVDTDRNLAFLGMAYFMHGDYDKAQAMWTRRLDKFPSGTPMALVFLASSHALNGNSSEAKLATQRLREIYPDFALANWGWSLSYQDPENRERLHRGARMAGVP